jgi:hypothetical protein
VRAELKQIIRGVRLENHLRRLWAKVNKNGPVPAHSPGLGPSSYEDTVKRLAALDRCSRPDGQGWAAVSRQHLCHGGSADEYAVPQSLASPTLGKGAPDGSDEVGRVGRNNRYVGLPFGQRAKGANFDSRPGDSSMISTKNEAS